MPVRYFRKPSPRIKLWMFGRPIQFVELGKFGYLASDDPLIQNHPKGAVAVLAEIDRGIREGQGGVQELSATQWENEFVKKKALNNLSPGLNKVWREEIRADATPDTLAPKLAQAVAGVSKAAPAVSKPAEGTPAPVVKSLRERANLGKL